MIRRIKNCVVSLLVCMFSLQLTCSAEDIPSPDGTQTLSSNAKNIDEPEHPNFATVRRENKIVWSGTFSGKSTSYSWSPSSRFVVVHVNHVDGESLESLFLLDTKDKPRLSNLHLERIQDAVGKTLSPSEEMPFGMRSGIDDEIWTGPQICKFVYLYQEGDRAAVAKLILDANQKSPNLKIESIKPIKDRTELQQVLNQARTELHREAFQTKPKTP